MSDAFDGKAVLPWMRSAEQIERRMAEIEDRMQKRHRILGDLRIALAVKVYRDQVDEGITLLDRCVKLIDESGSVAPNLLKDCLDYQQSIKDYNEGRKDRVRETVNRARHGG
jgi:hypothetical protein